MGKKNYIIPVFVPHRGCLNDCVFCNQRRITGQEDLYNLNEIENEIKSAVKTINFSENPQVEIAFYGGSFTGIKQRIQRQLLEIGYKYVKQHNLEGLRISTRPDYISPEILSVLKAYGVKRIELGVQSLDPDVLEKSKRGHDAIIVEKSVRLIKEYGFKCGIQLMIGLPGDTREKSIQSAKMASQLKPDFVRIYPTLIIKDTALEALYESNLYKPLTLEEAVDLAMEMYTIFLKNSIPVIRMGLQPTRNILEGEDVIDGPFHSSFRELVISRFLLTQISEILECNAFVQVKFELNPKDISYLVGNKGVNKKILMNDYNISKIKIVENQNIRRGHLHLHVDELCKPIRFS